MNIFHFLDFVREFLNIVADMKLFLKTASMYSF